MKTGYKVLVAEDGVDTAESMAQLLGLWGYDAVVCHDGEAALEAVVAHRPAVVLLDIALPKRDGLQVARWVRGQSRFADVVLVALTGFAREQDRVNAGQAGFDHFLAKPADPDEVRGLLARVVGGRAPPARAAGGEYFESPDTAAFSPSAVRAR